MRKVIDNSPVALELGANVGISTQHPKSDIASPGLPADSPPTDEEKKRLAELESVVDEKLRSFIEVGSALAEIQRDHLYRGEFKTFPEYCHIKWGLGRAYAYRLIAGSEVYRRLSTFVDIPLPANEAQVQPLVGLSSTDAVAAWGNAVKQAGSALVTAKLVRQAAAHFKPAKKARKASEGTAVQNIKNLGKLFTLNFANYETPSQMLAGISSKVELMRIRGVVSVVNIGLLPHHVALVHQEVSSTPGMKLVPLRELTNVFSDLPDWQTFYLDLLNAVGQRLVGRLLAFPQPLCLVSGDTNQCNCHSELVAKFLERSGWEVERLV